MSERAGLLVLALALVVGCGAQGGMDADASLPGDAGVAEDASSGPSPCPSVLPTDGMSCTRDKLECEYGTDPALECDTIATCTGGTWRITQTPFTGGMFCSTTVTDPSCPASASDVMQGQPCGSSFFECYYPAARCECRCPGPGNGVDCSPASAAKTWQCDSRTTAGCPMVRPRLGASCATEGQQCDYSGLDSAACWGDQVACSGGVWINAGSGLNC